MRGRAHGRTPLSAGFVARRTGLGFALGAALAGALAALGLAVGAYHTRAPNALLETAVMASLPVLAWLEELIFRRLLLERCERLAGRWAGLLATSLLFAALHVFNPDFGLAGGIGIFLAGIWLGQLYLQHRRLWCGTAAHLAWNAGIGVVLGLPVSGVFLGGLLHLGPTSDGLLSGGDFGPEASPLAWVVFGVAIVGLEIHHRWREGAK